MATTNGRLIPQGIAISEPRELETPTGDGTRLDTVRDVAVDAGPLTWRCVVVEPLLNMAIAHGMALQSAQRAIDDDLKTRQTTKGRG